MDIEKLKQEQLRLAKKVITSDSFGKIETIAGVDQSFEGDKVISAIVVCSYKDMKPIEKQHAEAESKTPYISGFLSYRESPAIVEAFNKLENKPDILIVDGNGILHPRRMGMASHVGILLDIPTIGVAKSLIGGHLSEGVVYMEKEARAYEFFSREYAKPLYISPGHKISLKTSLEIIKKCIVLPHKLPEPLHLAHRLADTLRKNI
ncbi:endonuclease V [Candidatus Woesearchaeota archaeon]|nr:endonuclease V [Candidatus Woesearchaeota archaeon]